MTSYIVDKRDLQFVLFEQIGAENLSDLGHSKGFTREDFEMMLEEGIKVASEVLAPLNASGDREGCRLENGQVIVPKGFKEAYKRFVGDGWLSPHGSPDFGGMGLPLTFTMCLSEIFIGANTSFMFFPGLTVTAAHVIESYGTPEQRDLYVRKMYGGEWTGTMCLTEPQAGSAVGELRSAAIPVEGADYYRIEGNKIFISAGDGDLSDNIIHLVLARIPGDPLGTKGLSLFIVPKYLPDEQGNPGQPNNVEVTGIEHKMGINASPTCSLSFGSLGETRGYLLGKQREGIVAMFQMMNEARIICGSQGAGMANTSYQQTLAYARERVQGQKMTDRSPDAPQVSIIEHPDVRRNLMIMKSLSEGMRALLIQTSYYHDKSVHSEDEEERSRYQGLLELLTPICKAYATDFAFWVTERGIQVLGGYGYISEYPVEQYLRDVKIAGLYEGTNGIQALDLLGRKMRTQNGGLFLNWLQETNVMLQSFEDHPRLSSLVGAVDSAKNALCQAAFSLPETGQSDPELFLLQATPFLEMFGHVELGCLFLKQAVIADEALNRIYEAAGATGETAQAALVESDDEAKYYFSKIKTAEFFAGEFLPRAEFLSKQIQSPSRAALDIVL